MFGKDFNPILDTDSYKLTHFLQYPPQTTSLFAYLESRGGRYGGTVFFGLQPIVEQLAQLRITQEHIDDAIEFCRRHGATGAMPFPQSGWERIIKKWGGRIPVRIRAVPEGEFVPTRNVLMTVQSTDPELFWLPTWIETRLMRVWYPTTVATKSFYCKKVILDFLKETSDDPLGELPYKLHDFGARGVSSQESAGIGGAAHLINFKGTDTIMGILHAERFYGGRSRADSVYGVSIPAMEHSTVTSWGGPDHEAESFLNMVENVNAQIIACVSDSYDINRAVEKYWCNDLLDAVKKSGKTIVIRPDSGDPVQGTIEILRIIERKLGMRDNSKGYKVMPPYYRIIWGDGNKTEDDPRRVLQAMKENRYSATNIAFGMGGGLLQLVDRDTCEFAFKVSAAKVNGDWREVRKNPVTSTLKASKAGRLDLIKSAGEYKTIALPDLGDDVEQARNSELVQVYFNGDITKRWTLKEVRERAHRAAIEP